MKILLLQYEADERILIMFNDWLKRTWAAENPQGGH